MKTLQFWGINLHLCENPSVDATSSRQQHIFFIHSHSLISKYIICKDLCKEIIYKEMTSTTTSTPVCVSPLTFIIEESSKNKIPRVFLSVVMEIWHPASVAAFGPEWKQTREHGPY